MKTSEQYNEWENNEIETLDYSKMRLEQFKIDLKAAIKNSILNEFIDAIIAYPIPL